VATATLTSKGQLTVPRAIREALHLRTGDRLEFDVEADGSVRVHALTRRVADVFGILARPATKRRSPGEMETELGEAFREGRL
jgi:antitoxin PrlF